jgi:hypothetical protein
MLKWGVGILAANNLTAATDEASRFRGHVLPTHCDDRLIPSFLASCNSDLFMSAILGLSLCDSGILRVATKYY